MCVFSCIYVYVCMFKCFLPLALTLPLPLPLPLPLLLLLLLLQLQLLLAVGCHHIHMYIYIYIYICIYIYVYIHIYWRSPVHRHAQSEVDLVRVWALSEDGPYRSVEIIARFASLESGT